MKDVVAGKCFRNDIWNWYKFVYDFSMLLLLYVGDRIESTSVPAQIESSIKSMACNNLL